MQSLPRKVRLELYNALIREESVFGVDGTEVAPFRFLDQIWDLDAMPSEDERFKTARQDISQHTVNNNDWTQEYLFIERLRVLDDDQIYIRFLETIVDPAFRKDEDEITRFVFLINGYLEKYSLALALVRYNEQGEPIYQVQNVDTENSFPIDLPKNTIPFFVNRAPTGRSDRITSHPNPPVYPSFVLSFNNGWNDYRIFSEFSLFYYKTENDYYSIGPVKIISDGEEITSVDVLDDSFTSLGNTFCSLGQTLEYYQALKKHFGRELESILYALRDAAFFVPIQEQFEKNVKFLNSLARYNVPERLLREARYAIYDYDMTNLYSFKYSFKAPYAEEPVDIDFQFDNQNTLPNRIYALIGKNGTGKTQLITSLPLNISRKKADYFLPRVPLFSKVIAVSYSVFDQFEIPKKTSSFDYVYCGLRDEKGEERSEKSLILKFHATCRKINLMIRVNQWRNLLLNFIDEDIVDLFVLRNEEESIHANQYDISTKGFAEAKKRLSSGQSIILYMITEIVAHIRFDSLLLYDEPETHLHPNAITQLMNTIYELTTEFESYCIIATHSPMIIRELFSRNVYILDREINMPSVRKIGIESFGENISTLTEEVFGNKEIPKQYKKIINDLAMTGRTFEQIIELLESQDMPLSRHTRLYIKAITNANN